MGITYNFLDYELKKLAYEQRRKDFMKTLQSDNEYIKKHLESISSVGQLGICRFCRINRIESIHDDACPSCIKIFSDVKSFGERTY